VSSRLGEVRKEIKLLEAEDELLDLVGGLFRTLIDSEVNENVQAVERLLTEGLQAVYEDMDLSVRANVEVQRGKVSVDLVTVQNQPDGSITEGGAMDAYGGSVTTMESVLMRIIVVLRRGMRPVLLLDESLGAIADHYVPNVGKFLALLCDRMGMDVLAVTHNPALVESAPKAYRIRKVNGAATFREVH
jgi:ABC-type iron transport system FetAB ATPase subunit